MPSPFEVFAPLNELIRHHAHTLPLVNRTVVIGGVALILKNALPHS